MRFASSTVALLPLLTPALTFDANIVAIGASITYGFKASHQNGYRDDLEYAVRDAGNQVRMVGTQKAGDMDNPFSEGYPGRVINDLKGIIPDTWGKLQHTPNVIVTLVGTNDMKPDAKDIAGAPERFSALLDEYQKLCPTCVIVASSLPPNGDKTQNDNINGFNTALKTLVEGRRKKGQHILFSDGNSDLTVKDDMADDKYHPNDQGYRKIGLRFADQVKEAGKLGWIKAAAKRSESETKTVAKPFVA